MMTMPKGKPAKVGRVRTTVTLDPDVVRALAHLQKERGQGLSEVLNDVVRAQRDARPSKKRFVQETSPMGLMVPIDNVWAVLGPMDDERFRLVDARLREQLG